jgi:uncharacterized protein (DUF1778 family)
VVGTRSERLEARLSSEQRAQIEHGAALAGESVSSFVVVAAVDRAKAIVHERTTTVVPDEYFDALISALDEPAAAPRLQRAARAADRRGRIKRA